MGVEWVERFRRIRQAYNLKWSSASSSVHPLLSSADFSEMLGYVKRLLREAPESLDVVCYALLTGLRVSEVFASMELLRTRFEEYFNPELGVLEHFRFPDIFARRTKTAYVSIYLPVLREYAERSRFKTYDSLRCFLHRKGLDLNINYCRKIFATYLRKHNVDPEIIDLLQGRIPKSVFAKHYYRPEIAVEFRRVREILSRMLVDLGLVEIPISDTYPR
jgi:intergrase/recombinase